jgi:mannose/fructose/N-acetylgalactosamine-specific phosphotransferase system component IID
MAVTIAPLHTKPLGVGAGLVGAAVAAVAAVAMAAMLAGAGAFAGCLVAILFTFMVYVGTCQHLHYAYPYAFMQALNCNQM